MTESHSKDLMARHLFLHDLEVGFFGYHIVRPVWVCLELLCRMCDTRHLVVFNVGL